MASWVMAKNVFFEVTVTLTLATKSNQLILESKWMFVPKLKKFPYKGIPEISHPQEWDGWTDVLYSMCTRVDGWTDNP